MVTADLLSGDEAVRPVEQPGRFVKVLTGVAVGELIAAIKRGVTWAWANVKAWVVRAFVRIPLVGRLGHVGKEARSQAFYETLTTTIFATMPFWLLPTVGGFMIKPRPAFDEALQRGEGLVFASVLLGPLVYVITKRYGRFNMRLKGGHITGNPLSMSFPYGGMFVVITVLICIVSGFSFAILRRDEVNGRALDQAGMELLSWILILVSILIVFLVTAYRNMLDDLEKDKSEVLVEEQPRQEGEFFNRWMESKDGH